MIAAVIPLSMNITKVRSEMKSILTKFLMLFLFWASLPVVANGQHACGCAELTQNRNYDDPNSFNLAGVKSKFWPIGANIKVRFIGGTATQRQKVETLANEWTAHANVRFDFGNHSKADIRVSFDATEPVRSYSKLGTDALGVTNQNEATMNFGWVTDTSSNASDSRVILHEFGHALGLVHEHQNPKIAIPWDKPAVYTYYERTNGFDKATTDHNIFRTLSASSTNHSTPDPKSIMIYSIPTELTIGDFTIPWNTTLSRSDKEFVGRIYPSYLIYQFRQNDIGSKTERAKLFSQINQWINKYNPNPSDLQILIDSDKSKRDYFVVLKPGTEPRNYALQSVNFGENEAFIDGTLNRKLSKRIVGFDHFTKNTGIYTLNFDGTDGPRKWKTKKFILDDIYDFKKRDSVYKEIESWLKANKPDAKYINSMVRSFPDRREFFISLVPGNNSHSFKMKSVNFGGNERFIPYKLGRDSNVRFLGFDHHVKRKSIYWIE